MPSLPTELSTGARRTFKALAGLALLVATFEVLRATGVMPSTSVPSTTAIFDALMTSVSEGDMGPAIGNTALAWFGGLLLACAIGIPLGILVGLSDWADSATRRAVEALRPVPAVALVPMAIVLFGIELEMQMFLIAIACVWPLLLGTRGGVRAVDPQQIDTARSFGLGPVATVRRVVLPAAIPAIATALRLSASLGLVVAVGAQLISGSPGLGNLLVTSQNAGRNDVVWACLLVTGVFGVTINLLLAAAERGVAGWQQLSTEGRR
ncbi:ABC transporter permease [Streptomyces cinereospinus]|uniref:ABC transporter permease n=1 Tax=Streptomyces cinereospinus TaxID=285561 RepID=A0ABV5N8G2_9ACTN